jgi:protein-S-isoprenylcysteine O-methyltransferase Ste14
MSRTETQNPSEQRQSPLQIRLYVASVVILVAGLIGATIIYATAPEPDSAELVYGIANNPQYVAELQQIGGTAEVVMAEFHQWFDSLWHGKTLACTVAFLCAAAAGICFFAAHYRIFEAPHQPGDDQDPRNQ